MWSQLFLVVTPLYSANQAFPGLAAAQQTPRGKVRWVRDGHQHLQQLLMRVPGDAGPAPRWLLR